MGNTCMWWHLQRAPQPLGHVAWPHDPSSRHGSYAATEQTTADHGPAGGSDAGCVALAGLMRRPPLEHLGREEGGRKILVRLSRWSVAERETGTREAKSRPHGSQSRVAAPPIAPLRLGERDSPDSS